MLRKFMALFALVLLVVSVSGCFYHTEQRARQTSDNLQVLFLDGETPTLWME